MKNATKSATPATSCPESETDPAKSASGQNAKTHPQTVASPPSATGPPSGAGPPSSAPQCTAPPAPTTTVTQHSDYPSGAAGTMTCYVESGGGMGAGGGSTVLLFLPENTRVVCATMPSASSASGAAAGQVQEGEGNRLGMMPGPGGGLLPGPPPAHMGYSVLLDPTKAAAGIPGRPPGAFYPGGSESYIPGVGMMPFYPSPAAALFSSAAAANTIARGAFAGSPMGMFGAGAMGSPLGSPAAPTPGTPDLSQSLKNPGVQAAIVSLPSSAILQAGQLATFAQQAHQQAQAFARASAVQMAARVASGGRPHHEGDQERRPGGGKAEKSNHVKKPLNAFMLYMKEMRPVVMAEVGLKERQSAEINRILGRRWHDLSKDEQQKYYEMAREARQKHLQDNPGWSARENYAINKKKRKKRDKNQNNMELKKCRARFGVDQQDKWCKHCRRKKKCLLFREEGQAVREFLAGSSGPASNDSLRDEMDADEDDVDDLLSNDDLKSEDSPGSGLVTSTTLDHGDGAPGPSTPQHQQTITASAQLGGQQAERKPSVTTKSFTPTSFLFGGSHSHPGLAGIMASTTTSPHHVSSTSRDHHPPPLGATDARSPCDGGHGPPSASSTSSSGITGDAGPSPASSTQGEHGRVVPSPGPLGRVIPSPAPHDGRGDRPPPPSLTHVPLPPSSGPAGGPAGINHSIANLTMKSSPAPPPSFIPSAVVQGRITT